MATWTVRGPAGTRENLTIYQLQELVRSGVVGADDEVSTADVEAGAFRRVREVERLARCLPTAYDPPRPADERGPLRELGLEVGPDGKPLPPSSEAIAAMLARGLADERRARERTTPIVRVVALLLLAAIVLGVGWFLYQVFVVGPGAR